jgi:hypothetical protein
MLINVTTHGSIVLGSEYNLVTDHCIFFKKGYIPTIWIKVYSSKKLKIYSYRIHFPRDEISLNLYVMIIT